jgi:hypothetical protein
MDLGTGNSSRSWNSNSKWNSELELKNQLRPVTEVTTMIRTVAMGDIHCCATASRRLIEAVDPEPGDTVVVLAHVIEWGPDSRDFVQQPIDLSPPGGVVHYVESHLYVPPLEFIEAVLRCTDYGSPDYHEARRKSNGGNAPPLVPHLLKKREGA